MSINPETLFTLDDAVGEVLGLLTGLDLTYDPELDRYRAITRQINRSLRANALEAEWSYYASLLELSPLGTGARTVRLPLKQRARIINDDSVRLVDADGKTRCWAYFLPRDALHKYADRSGLWCSIVYRDLHFSRPLTEDEGLLEVHIPTMREPTMFRLPDQGETVPDDIKNQEIDFPYPDVVVARAAYFYAQSDPVMQPRVQTLEEGYKDFMYQLMERDSQITDTPYQNEFLLNVQSGLMPIRSSHRHPHAE